MLSQHKPLAKTIFNNTFQKLFQNSQAQPGIFNYKKTPETKIWFRVI